MKSRRKVMICGGFSCVTRKICLPRATQHPCLLCDTADVYAVSHSRHVCRVTQKPSLLSGTADMSAVWQRPIPQRPDAIPWFCFARGRGGEQGHPPQPPPATRNHGIAHTTFTSRESLGLRRWKGGASPPPCNAKPLFCTAGGEGHAPLPPTVRNKTTFLCRRQSSGQKYI